MLIRRRIATVAPVLVAAAVVLGGGAAAAASGAHSPLAHGASAAGRSDDVRARPIVHVESRAGTFDFRSWQRTLKLPVAFGTATGTGAITATDVFVSTPRSFPNAGPVSVQYLNERDSHMRLGPTRALPGVGWSTTNATMAEPKNEQPASVTTPQPRPQSQPLTQPFRSPQAPTQPQRWQP